MPGKWTERRKLTCPLELWEVLAEEFEEYGGKLPPEFDQLADAYIDLKGSDDEMKAARTGLESALFRYLGSARRAALCFSGGGVRSATFGLGVLHGLATCTFSQEKDKNKVSPPLAEFDYLSTVSGGGYVGSWFSAWAAREESENGEPHGPQAVMRDLGKRGGTLDPDPEPLLHIRRYCAFLTPKLGLLSADSWTLVCTVVRNMVLNWLILLPLIMAALLFPALYQSLLLSYPSPGTISTFLVLGGIGIISGTAYVVYHLPAFGGPSRAGESEFIAGGLLPLTLGAIALSFHWAWRISEGNSNYSPFHFARFGATFHTLGWLAAVVLLGLQKKLTRKGKRLSHILAGLIAAFLSGILAGSLSYLVSTMFEEGLVEQIPVYACLAVPAILGAFLAAALLAVGMASKATQDDDRELWARAGGWVLIVMVGWLALSASVLLAPQWALTGYHRLFSWMTAVGVGGVASWFGFNPSTAAGRRGDKDSKAAESNPLMDVAAKLAAPVFLLILMVVLADANWVIVTHIPVWMPWLPGSGNESICELWLMAACLGLALLSSRFINVNRFSLHAMYKARLVRTYLGASRKNRQKTANRFTDLDEADNLPMAELSNRRPLHIVNMALNLVGGKNLAWQQRKAESFTCSRLRTGSLRVGFQYTWTYGGGHGLSLGSAVAISGAAASPNMGYHSSPVISLIMTLFNARLGWWLANPGDSGKRFWKEGGPSLAFVPIVNEALGRTNDESTWVYLSDGGHFENLGLYEMVLRRCSTIIVVDGSQDPSYNFEDLANAVRKIRVDLGISIEFSGMPIYSATDLRNRYCAVGSIRYDLADPDSGCEPGKLVYIKACLNGTEPEDVLNYASLEPTFPQQGTEELWFDESQFESYRRLGLHIAEKISCAAPPTPAATGIERIVQCAEAYIQFDDTVRHTRWPKPLKFTGSIGGTFGGSNLELKTDFEHK